jgi:hypothetical protein
MASESGKQEVSLFSPDRNDRSSSRRGRPYSFALFLGSSFSRPAFRTEGIPFDEGLLVALSTNTWTNVPTALTSLTPCSKTPIS